MNFGEIARKAFVLPALAAMALGSAVIPQAVMAQAAPVAAAVAPPAEIAPVEVTPVEVTVADAAAPADGAAAVPAFEHYGADMIKGQPESGAYGFQPQFTEDGRYALVMHDAILMPIITVITLLVLGLLLYVMARYNRRTNPVPSKTSHNTVIEIIWTVIPVLILVAIAVPSITLIARQYQSPPEDAVTIKATGYQWYWGYTYADNGGFEVISNMMPEDQAVAGGFPRQLEADNRMVVPVGVPLRIQVVGSDVIHAFGVPSLWFKIDAVPGRINERMLTISEPGIYYGQCMELCGARHGYMPIAIEARPMAEFEAWVRAQGGQTRAELAAAAAAEAAAAAAPVPAVPGAEAPAAEATAAPAADAAQPTT